MEHVVKSLFFFLLSFIEIIVFFLKKHQYLSFPEGKGMKHEDSGGGRLYTCIGIPYEMCDWGGKK